MLHSCTKTAHSYSRKRNDMHDKIKTHGCTQVTARVRGGSLYAVATRISSVACKKGYNYTPGKRPMGHHRNTVCQCAKAHLLPYFGQLIARFSTHHGPNIALITFPSSTHRNIEIVYQSLVSEHTPSRPSTCLLPARVMLPRQTTHQLTVHSVAYRLKRRNMPRSKLSFGKGDQTRDC